LYFKIHAFLKTELVGIATRILMQFLLPKWQCHRTEGNKKEHWPQPGKSTYWLHPFLIYHHMPKGRHEALFMLHFKVGGLV